MLYVTNFTKETTILTIRSKTNDYNFVKFYKELVFHTYLEQTYQSIYVFRTDKAKTCNQCSFILCQFKKEHYFLCAIF